MMWCMYACELVQNPGMYGFLCTLVHLVSFSTRASMQSPTTAKSANDVDPHFKSGLCQEHRSPKAAIDFNKIGRVNLESECTTEISAVDGIRTHNL